MGHAGADLSLISDVPTSRESSRGDDIIEQLGKKKILWALM